MLQPTQDKQRVVALFTRAWIEIPLVYDDSLSYYVALFTRAWIEIPATATLSKGGKSPSSRGRGLKLILR